MKGSQLTETHPEMTSACMIYCHNWKSELRTFFPISLLCDFFEVISITQMFAGSQCI